MAGMDQNISLSLLPPTLLIEVLSWITHDSKRISWFNSLCRETQEALCEDRAWLFMCRKYWYATEDRLRDWPSLSPRGVYKVLEQWTPLEGYYVLAGAFPWGLIVLVRICEGCVTADVVRFVNSEGGNFDEVLVPLFKIRFSEDPEKPGVVTSTFQSSWDDACGADVSRLDPASLEAHHMMADGWRHRMLGESGLFRPKLAIRVSGPTGQEGEDEEDEDSAMEAALHNLAVQWDPGQLLRSAAEANTKTAAMLKALLSGKCGVPCDLGLVRGPDEFEARDPNIPRIRPGLYVGDYGHDFYGQFRTEVLLVGYLSLSSEELSQESFRQRVFSRPDGEPSPDEIQELDNLQMDVTFLRGTKQCGDFHVPLGAVTFVAVCGPPEAILTLAHGKTPPSSVRNRLTNQMEVVIQSWRGFGTLATPGFGRPSWAGGWLVRIQDDSTTGNHRFAFCWDMNQDAVVLQWIRLQDSSPFLQRAWLPQDVR
eukprot:TRINITY_DN35082_c0_g1_i1.p1 TRINITY_DN35082_c0_g1~~TRINITY_DN35082_c0_g1_i1.p1  ORF type:complete len:481 (-),score=75.20 TRINITY_DN35082_c0_g1_i1:321-1763(-)